MTTSTALQIFIPISYALISLGVWALGIYMLGRLNRPADPFEGGDWGVITAFCFAWPLLLIGFPIFYAFTGLHDFLFSRGKKIYNENQRREQEAAQVKRDAEFQAIRAAELARRADIVARRDKVGY